jgi:hypothetical protein
VHLVRGTDQAGEQAPAQPTRDPIPPRPLSATYFLIPVCRAGSCRVRPVGSTGAVMAKKWACLALLVVAAALIPARWAEKTCLGVMLPGHGMKGLAWDLHPHSEHQVPNSATVIDLPIPAAAAPWMWSLTSKGPMRVSQVRCSRDAALSAAASTR